MHAFGAPHIPQAILDPASVYQTPADLVADDQLDEAEKLVLLGFWEADARELAVAEDENMGGGEPSLLTEILAAKNQLGGQEQAQDGLASAHKQGCVVADASVLRVRHFLQRAPYDIHPDVGPAEAERRLAEDDNTEKVLVVVDGAEVVGTLVAEDLAKAGPRVLDLPVRQIMTTKLAFCFLDDQVATAHCIMERENSDFLLVIEPDGTLAGILRRDALPVGPEARAALSPSGRHGGSGGEASTIHPAGLDVYPAQPTIKVRAALKQ